ncbi:transposase [Amycolatopsis sp.]|uniref:transposase n=1 Tax=Amycolatopsis sp. TaxID=37632 RepID=UPI0039C858D6
MLVGSAVQQIAPDLINLAGVGPISAAPIPASSGMTHRHRLNRGGDRQLNRALHTITLIRMRVDPSTKAYIAKRAAEGKTSRDARRCIKRALAGTIFVLPERTKPQDRADESQANLIAA